MSRLVGSFRTKKEAVATARSKINSGFSNVSVIPKVKSTSTQSQLWSNPNYYSGRKVKVWEVRIFSDESEMKQSILDD